MYSYQHRYHAGNFADLHKHICLLAIIQYLHKKPGGIFYLDAFAGEGYYDITSSEAQRNQEYLSGYGLLDNLKSSHQLFKDLADLVKTDILPGSPAVIASGLRENDRAFFIDNHPQAYQNLYDNFQYDKNIKTSKRESYEAVKSLVPYTESRGLILLDPSYEVKDEYCKIVDLVISSYKKNATGIYMIWYPIIANKNYHKELFQLFDKINNEKIWHHQFLPNQNQEGMIGSGLIVINMPWSVDKDVERCFGF